MNESEFRDWARAALRAMDQKLERLAKERAEPAKVEFDKRIQGEIVELNDILTKAVKDGQVAGLAIAFVNDRGKIQAGYAAQDGYFQLAGAATFIGLEILEHFRQEEAARAAANENQEATA